MHTLPNDESKKNRRFFSLEAMHTLIDRRIEHVLADIPSLDKMHDEGRLTNHHLFWNVPAEGHALTADTKIFRTITKMIFVPDEVRDGYYLLNLQVPAFVSDAALSRPVI